MTNTDETKSEASPRARDCMLRRLLRSLVRKTAQGIVSSRDAEQTARLESLIRGEDIKETVAALGRLPLRYSLLLGIATRLDPDGVRGALRRGHYHAVRQHHSPLFRTYQYQRFTVTHDIRNKSQWNAYILGQHQPGVTYWLRKSVRPGGCALDIGANAGVLTLELARSIGPDGEVYAFEPNPDAYALLEDAVDRNNLREYVHVYSFALGTEEATTTLSIPEGNNGAASIRAPEPGEKSIQTRVRPFHDWWKEMGQPHIDLIKLDVEGFEDEVIEGLAQVLKRDQPILVMELSPHRYNAHELVASIREMGYQVTRITETAPFQEEMSDNISQQTDILFSPIIKSDN